MGEHEAIKEYLRRIFPFCFMTIPPGGSSARDDTSYAALGYVKRAGEARLKVDASQVMEWSRMVG